MERALVFECVCARAHLCVPESVRVGMCGCVNMRSKRACVKVFVSAHACTYVHVCPHK